MAINPVKLLQARHAILAGEPSSASIEILLKPFILDGDLIDTSIRLDGINLPSCKLSDLASQTFTFPLNPDGDYIDGSVYWNSRHHPVDVSSLSFIVSRRGQLTLLVKACFNLLAQEGEDFVSTPFVMSAPISSCHF